MSVHLEKQYKFNTIEDVWNKIPKKLIIYVISATNLESLNSKGEPKEIKGQIFVRFSTSTGKVKTNELAPNNPEFNQILFMDIQDPNAKLHIEIRQSKKVISEAFIDSINTLKMNALAYLELTLHKPPKDIKKKVRNSELKELGKLKCRFVFSDLNEVFYDSIPPAVYPSEKDDSDGNFEFHYDGLKKKLKTGDLIVFHENGILGTFVNIATNTYFSRIGMVMKSRNKYTEKEKLYLVELTKNPQKFIDDFKDAPIEGLSIFRIWERIHGISGGAIWLVQLKDELDKDPKENMVDWIMSVHNNGFDINNFTPIQSLSKMIGEFGFKDTSNIYDLYSTSFFAQALKLGGRRLQNDKPYMYPADIINQDIFEKPVLLREVKNIS